jgi:heavy metal sensor kinase
MTVLLVVRSFWIYLMMDQRLTATTDFGMDLELETLEGEVRTVPGSEELKRYLEEHAANRRDLGIEVATAAGEVLFRRPNESQTSAARLADGKRTAGKPQHATIVSPDGGRNRTATATVPSAVGPLTIELRRSMQAEQNEVRDFAMILLTTGPMVIVAALGVGYLVSSRALTPVDNMIRAAKDITAKRLDQRIDVPNTGDELARLAQTLNEMIDRLHNSFEEMRRFTADAAHDLRTPVAALRTEVEVSLMADNTIEEYRHSLQTVLDEAIHLSRLTGQLLDLSREDHGIHSNQDEVVRLDSLVQSVMDDLRLAAENKQISVVASKIGPWSVPGDQVRLRRVVMNLLDNAIQYTPAGGHVWIDGELSAARATLVIADDGPGVPADDLPHIFDRFRRVDKARNRQMGGTGLGLAICKSIVEAHGGEITMDSEVGRGTRVRVTLPSADSRRAASHAG